MTAQQQTDVARALAASRAQQSKIKRENAAHTPGPWRQSEDAPWIIKQDNRPICDGGVIVCSTSAHGSSGFFPAPSEGRANARLIAAAPELLQELKNIANANVSEWDDPSEFQAWAQSRARAAIAKVTGGAT